MSFKLIYQDGKNGVKYQRSSFMHGGGWYSYEYDVKPGDVRVINGIISKAWIVSKRGIFRKPEVHWVSVDPKELRKVQINERPEEGIAEA